MQRHEEESTPQEINLQTEVMVKKFPGEFKPQKQQRMKSLPWQLLDFVVDDSVGSGKCCFKFFKRSSLCAFPNLTMSLKLTVAIILNLTYQRFYVMKTKTIP